MMVTAVGEHSEWGKATIRVTSNPRSTQLLWQALFANAYP